MRTWIKLYTEILNDPKMGRLSDSEYRTCINLFLLAGHIDHDGELGNTAEVAWALRMSEEVVERDMLGLSALGIVTRRLDGAWYVTKYADRQSRAPSAEPGAVRERVQKYREKQDYIFNIFTYDVFFDKVNYGQKNNEESGHKLAVVIKLVMDRQGNGREDHEAGVFPD